MSSELRLRIFTRLHTIVVMKYPRMVYIGQFVKHHLWFDECDYLSDNYRHRSFVFAKSKDEVESKLEKLRKHEFPEFREELAPLIYWDDKYDDMEVTDDITLK